MAFQRAHDEGWGEDVRQRVLTRWPALTESEIESTQGNREQLIGLLQVRLGYAQENARRDLDEVLRGREIAPRDVADEDTRTGSSGPVPNTQVPSGLTSFPDRASEERAARGTTSTGEPAEVGPGPRDQPLGQTPGQQPGNAAGAWGAQSTSQRRGEQSGGGAQSPPGGSAPDAAGSYEQRWRQQQDRRASARMGQTEMGSMMPMVGATVILALISFSVIMFVRRRRASRRNRFISMVAGSAAAGLLAKAARRYAMAPKDVMRAVERMR